MVTTKERVSERNEFDQLIALMYYSTYEAIAEKLRISTEYLYQIKRGTKKISEKVEEKIKSIQIDLSTRLPHGAAPVIKALREQAKTSCSLEALESFNVILEHILEQTQEEELKFQLYFLKSTNHFRIAQTIEKESDVNKRKQQEIKKSIRYGNHIVNSNLSVPWKILSEINLIGYAYYHHENTVRDCALPFKYRWFYRQYMNISERVENPNHKELVFCNALRMASQAEEISLCQKTYQLLWQQMEVNKRAHINHCMTKLIEHDPCMMFFHENRKAILGDNSDPDNITRL